MLWTMWTFGFGARLVRAAVLVRAARRTLRPFPRQIEARLATWMALRQRGRLCDLAVCDAVPTAAVMGIRRPVIALSPSLVERLSAADLDRIVVHEWAHVRRRDHLLNPALRVVQAIAGWHPAVWYLGRRLQWERELACDETAIRVLGSPKAYAATLVALASLDRSRRTLAVPALFGAGRLRDRISRILAFDRTPSGRWQAALVAGALITIVSAAAVARSVPSVELRTSMPAVTFAGFDDRVASARPAYDGGTTTSVAAPQPDRKTIVNPTRPALESPQRAATLAAAIDGNDARDVGVVDDSMSESTANAPVLLGSRALTPVSPFAATLVSAPGVRPPETAALPSTWSSARQTGTAAANAATAIARGSAQAAGATAGFFDRFGRSVAGAFQP